jgi:16S rRNA U1498 N3-methylase RsmE
VGPEGGLTPKDYENFLGAQVVGLGETVLRMETASIIGAWVLKNML